MASSMALPDEQLARQLAIKTFGIEPIEVRRFPTGLTHYVFEATFDAHPSVVIRIAASHGHAAMRNAAKLSQLLRPRRVPLPAILAENLDAPYPYLILERLPGCDLGEVVRKLSKDQLESVAATVVEAQRATAGLPCAAQKYGYAVSSEEAPYQEWSQVLSAHLERSQKRMATARLYDVRETETLSSVLKDLKEEIQAAPAIPFLHDTTTKNVIVSPELRCSGIVDVDDLCFGDPRYVVALTEASLLARRIPLHYTNSWMRIAGFSVDRLYRVYVALFLADFMAERGQNFNGNEPAMDAELDQHLHRLYLGALSQL
jgi:aminoglycoside phosphotransferase